MAPTNSMQRTALRAPLMLSVSVRIEMYSPSTQFIEGTDWSAALGASQPLQTGGLAQRCLLLMPAVC
jgi:hypothetical protein